MYIYYQVVTEYATKKVGTSQRSSSDARPSYKVDSSIRFYVA
jgi:hypothetical protein